MTKVVVSIPNELFAAFDAAARERGVSRSALVAEAMRGFLRREEMLAMKRQIAAYDAGATADDLAEDERWLAVGRRAAAKVRANDSDSGQRRAAAG